MIYFPVQFYAIYPVLSGVILSFSIKCLIMPHTTLNGHNIRNFCVVNNYFAFFSKHYGIWIQILPCQRKKVLQFFNTFYIFDIEVAEVLFLSYISGSHKNFSTFYIYSN